MIVLNMNINFFHDCILNTPSLKHHNAKFKCDNADAASKRLEK